MENQYSYTKYPSVSSSPVAQQTDPKPSDRAGATSTVTPCKKKRHVPVDSFEAEAALAEIVAANKKAEDIAEELTRKIMGLEQKLERRMETQIGPEEQQPPTRELQEALQAKDKEIRCLNHVIDLLKSAYEPILFYSLSPPRVWKPSEKATEGPGEKMRYLPGYSYIVEPVETLKTALHKEDPGKDQKRKNFAKKTMADFDDDCKQAWDALKQGLAEAPPQKSSVFKNSHSLWVLGDVATCQLVMDMALSLRAT
ncbi:Integrase core domain protein [Aspergillus sclerotialis]|uniref:Integrase core domain protein n=1 Tax=Aspergillus sclerotialis TaxID=2070753 RepID=A0A3A2ZA57_9EURO|nr:Integrase core domain protein [Aspergillus sclerotialis]